MASLIVFGLCLPARAGGKVSYGTDEGPALQASIAFGSQKHYRVKNVIDGDTIELEDGRRVRYLGVDTPEVRYRKGEEWVYDPQPFSVEATHTNQALVQGKVVRLEFDQERKDRFGRLLAYVFVKMDLAAPALYDGEVYLDSHEIFVNAYLVREGYAETLIIAPNHRYAGHLTRLESKARRAQRNLWANTK